MSRSVPSFYSVLVPALFWAVLLSFAAFAVPVQVDIAPLENKGLHALLESYSPLFWPGEDGPDSETMLKAYARRHAERLKDVLNAAGYYDSEVEQELHWDEGGSRVSYEAQTGALYHFASILLAMDSPRQEMDLFALETVLTENSELKKGAPALADSVLSGEKELIRMLGNGGFPFARITDRKITIDRDEKALHIVFTFDSGPHLLFGDLRIVGLETVRQDAIERELPWMKGAPFQSVLLEEGQANLQKTGLFSIVRLKPAPEEEIRNGQIDIIVEVNERRHRTVHAGLQYRSDEGIGAGFEWEHRNFLGLSRRLRIQGQVTEIEQGLGAVYDVQQYRRADQTLTLHARVRQLHPERYKSRRVELGAWVERTISPALVYGWGASLRLGRVEAERRGETYHLALFPLEARYDRRDDPLDSHRGFQITNRLTPFVDITDTNMFFIKNELNVSHFLPLSKDQGFIFATRFRLGLMGGGAQSQIPADERFFAGGGGSVRGYAYQNIGPLDKRGHPVGGRSITDWSLELRKKITEKIGIVAFVDGGMAYQSMYPDFNTAPRWGAGLGLRYQTPLGPMRLDAAVPVNRRRHLDSSLQVYMSIGQAF